jgi:hypothetical protein
LLSNRIRSGLRATIRLLMTERKLALPRPARADACSGERLRCADT